MAELGFIVIALEGSGNPNRSKSFQDACYGNMGENTLPDQIAGLKQLAQKYSYLDLNAVGFWGHSGGGFATATAMFTYPDFLSLVLLSRVITKAGIVKMIGAKDILDLKQKIKRAFPTTSNKPPRALLKI